MKISPQQVKAGRALLSWNQQELALKAELNIDQVRSFESGRSRSLDVIENLCAAFERERLEFVDGGVALKKVHSYHLSSYLALLHDISATLIDGGEILKHCEDDRLCTPEVIKKIEEMDRSGISERLTILESNSFVLRNKKLYRKIPDKYFKNSEVMIIYANKVAFFVETEVIVVVSDRLADSLRDQFEYWWDTGKKL